MKICPSCLSRYPEGLLCPSDGVELLDYDGGDERAGQVLADRFVVLESIGKGGMGVVYAAWQRSTSRRVALKLLPADAVGDAQIAARFMREAKVTAMLRCPHTVTVLDFGQLDGGELYLVMELIEGEPLSTLLQRQHHFDVEEAVTLATQICLSLEEAHAHGLVHRDLKPGNVMVQRVGGRPFAKVLDFGIVKVLDASVTLTDKGAGPGTPAYMSPEQAQSKPVGPATDIYSTAVLLFELLTGRRPFTGDTPLAVMLQHVNEAPPRLTDLGPAFGAYAALDRILQRALSKQPEARYPSIAALRAELSDVSTTTPTRPAVAKDEAAPVAMGVAETADSLPAPVSPPASRPGIGFNFKAWGCSVQLMVAVGAAALFVVPMLNEFDGVEGDDRLIGPPAAVQQSVTPASAEAHAPIAPIAPPPPPPIKKKKENKKKRPAPKVPPTGVLDQQPLATGTRLQRESQIEEETEGKFDIPPSPKRTRRRRARGRRGAQPSLKDDLSPAPPPAGANAAGSPNQDLLSASRQDLEGCGNGTLLVQLDAAGRFKSAALDGAPANRCINERLSRILFSAPAGLEPLTIDLSRPPNGTK